MIYNMNIEAWADDDLIQVEPLTLREREVLEALAGGGGSKHAARALHISYETIRTHQRNIYRKLGAHTLCSALNVYRARYPVQHNELCYGSRNGQN